MSNSPTRRSGNRKQLPDPPSEQRRQPLPWNTPKSPGEDPNAMSRLDKILSSPSYRQADQDIDFFKSNDARPMRLQLDFLKPEIHLREHDIRDTIVVFGSTRIAEPSAANRSVKELRNALNQSSENENLQLQLNMAERLQAKSHYYDIAREFGRIVSNSGGGPSDCRLVIMTGGGPGIMEAANRGAHDQGAKNIGLNITLPHEQFPNPYISPSLCFRFHYFALRKMHFLLRAKALVVFPGGYGTFDELFETLTLIQTRTITPLPIVLVGEDYWRKALNIDFLVDEGVIDPEDRELFWYAEDAEEIWRDILNWYESIGEPLIAPNKEKSGQ